MKNKKASKSLMGYRPEPLVYYNILRKRVKTNFDKNNFRHCELRWAAMYCCEENFNITTILNRTSLHSKNINKFFAHYGIDPNRRDLINKENN